jgi:hypothetical protein
MGLGIPTIACNTNNSQSTEEGAGFGPALLQFVTSECLPCFLFGVDLLRDAWFCVDLAAAPDAQVPRVLSMSLGR